MTIRGFVWYGIDRVLRNKIIGSVMSGRTRSRLKKVSGFHKRYLMMTLSLAPTTTLALPPVGRARAR